MSGPGRCGVHGVHRLAVTEAYAYDNPAFFTALFRSVLLASHFIRALCDPPQQFSGTARAETWFVTFVTEVSLRLAAPRTGGALYRRYLASRLALSSPDLFSSAPTTPALPPSGRWRIDTSLSLFPDTFLLCLESD